MSIVKVFDQTIPYVSGYTMRSRYIVESLTRLGLKVRAFTSPLFSYDNLRETLGGVDYIRTVQGRWNSGSAPPLVRECNVVRSICENLIKNWSSESQLIHAHSPVLDGLGGIRAARQLDVPFLYETRAFWEDAAVDLGKATERGPRYRMTRTAETHVFRNADHITVICEGLKQDIVERGVDPDRITIMPNGVDSEKFVPVERDDELARSLGVDGCKVVGFIGTFFHFEGLQLLMEAARRIAARRDDIRFLLVGGGQVDEEVRRMASDYNLGRTVTFTGRVKHEDVSRYYSICDILAYPRTSKRITELVTPLKPLEGMALKKLVLGSDVGGIRELVTDGETGLLFKADDVDDLVEKIEYAADNESQTQSIADAGRDYVVRERNWLEICKRYPELYRRMGIDIQTQPETTTTCDERDSQVQQCASA